MEAKATKRKQDMPPEEVKTTAGLIFFWPLGVYLALKHRPYWFKKTSFIVILVIYAFVISWLTMSAVLYSSDQSAGEKQWLKTVSLEKGRNYDIEVANIENTAQKNTAETVDINCNLKQAKVSQSSDSYNSQSDIYKCSDAMVKGTYSEYVSTLLTSEGFGSLNAKDGNYTLNLKLGGFTKKDWENSSLDFVALQKDGINKIVKLSIKNKVLDSATMAEKVVTVHYNFTSPDIALLKKQADSYKAYVKAENARKAKEAAEKKAQEEAKKLEAERQKQAQQTQSAPTTQSQPSTPTNPSPESDNLPLKAICKDGSVSYQDTPSLPNYRGMCSGHQGIRTKLGRVP